MLADQIFVKRIDGHARLRVDFLRIGGLVTFIDDVQLLVGLLAAHVRLQSTQDGEETGAALNNIWRQSFLLEHARQPNLPLREGKFQRGRQDANDRERSSVKDNCLAHDILIAAETFLPESVAEQGHVRTTWPVVVRGESAAEERLHAERPEKILGHTNTI